MEAGQAFRAGWKRKKISSVSPKSRRLSLRVLLKLGRCGINSRAKLNGFGDVLVVFFWRLGMSRGKASGYVLEAADAPIIFGMVARGDRDHDIAAWFGVNQGRVAEVKDGKFGVVAAAPASSLPPQGAPGVKGRRLYEKVQRAIDALNKGDSIKAKALLEEGVAVYDTDEA